MSGGAPDGLEIERVWVLARMPSDAPIDAAERWEIEQGYLPETDAGSRHDFPEGRLRRITTGSGDVLCRHTVKRGTGLVREETEREITSAEFERLWPLTKGRRITKTRYRIRDGGFVWELDRFHDLPLVMLEVELPNERVVPEMPTWTHGLVARDVTFDARYRNAALAIVGLPTDA